MKCQSYLGGRQLPYNARQEVFPNGTMTIKNVERKEDATGNGAYTCVARNDEGYSARSDLQVSVMGKFKNKIKEILNELTMGEIKYFKK